MPSNREIAELANVSVSTVSLVRRNMDNVSDEMRQRVLQAIRQLEIKEAEQHVLMPPRDEPARQTKSILVLHSEILTNTEYFGAVLEGLQLGADLFHCQLRLAPNGSPSGNHITSLYLSNPSLRPDAIVLVGVHISDEVLQSIRATSVPCVILGHIPPGNNEMSWIGPDDVAVGRLAAQYLLDCGHRNIGFVDSEPGAIQLVRRWAGVKQAFEDRGLSLDDRVNRLQDDHIEMTLASYLSDHPELTALIFGMHHGALNGLPQLQRAGYRVPDDLSLIVIDDTEVSRTFESPITTVKFPLIQMGQMAIKMLIELINAPWIEQHQVICKPWIIERASCATLSDH